MEIEKLPDGRLRVPIHLRDGEMRADGYITIGPEHELYEESLAILKRIGKYSKTRKPDLIVLLNMKLSELESKGIPDEVNRLIAIAGDDSALEKYFADELSLYTDDEVEDIPALTPSEVPPNPAKPKPTLFKAKPKSKPKKGKKPKGK